MDGQMPQPTNQVNQVNIVKSSSSIFKSVISIPVIALLLGFGLGFLAKSILPLNKTPAAPTQLSSTPKPTIDESNLPVSLSLLTNPIIFQWSGSIQGKLIKKDKNTFTLADESNHNVTITDIMPSGDKWKTVFFEKSGKNNKEISLETIPLGSLLRGDFYIFKNGPNTPVGGMFFKQ